MRQLRRAQESADALVKRREEQLSEARRALAEAQSAALVKNPDVDLDGSDSPASRGFILSGGAAVKHKGVWLGAAVMLAVVLGLGYAGWRISRSS